jgi:hypothetical protein
MMRESRDGTYMSSIRVYGALKILRILIMGPLENEFITMNFKVLRNLFCIQM